MSKSFGAVRALVDVDVQIYAGTIHALVGENGAGKSTLGKVVSGVHRADRGTLTVRGRSVQYGSPRQALEDGITTITQEIALLTKQTVLENVVLGAEPTRAGVLDRRAMRRTFDAVIERTGFDLDPSARVRDLRLADQKRVEVLQAIARDAAVIVMDEPTAMLADDEARAFRDIVTRLRADGHTVIYVSHFLSEVLEIADTVTVMRNGGVVETLATSEATPERLVESMLGRSMASRFPPVPPVPKAARVVLEVRGLTSDVFDGIDLTVRSGEIVGLAGLVGSGRTRLARTIFGAERQTGGEVRILNHTVRIRSTADAVAAGLHYVPESRKDLGLLLKQNVRFNMSLPHLSRLTRFAGIVPIGRETTRAMAMIRHLQIRPPRHTIRVSHLSGGNQQKVMFGKWLFQEPTVLIVDEPTRGVDVGAKHGIYELLVDLAHAGIGIVLISSEIEEILGLAHRVLVMRQGSIVAEFGRDGTELDEAAIMHAAFASDASNPAITDRRVHA